MRGVDPRRPSPAAAKVHLARMARALDAVGNSLLPPQDAIVWPVGLDRSLLATMRLPTRAWNSLNQAGLTEGTAAISVRTLLRTSNFGRIALADLLRSVERYLMDCTLTSTTPEYDSPQHARPPGASDVATEAVQEAASARPTEGARPAGASDVATESLASLFRALPRGTTPSWGYLPTDSLRALLATSADVLETATLADVLRPDVVRLAARMGLDNAIGSAPLHEATLRTTSLPAMIAQRLRRTLDSSNEAQSTVVRFRLAQPKPATLHEVGHRLGVSRQRVGQLQQKVERKIRRALGPELQVIADTLSERLDPVVRADELEERIDRIFPDSSEVVQAVMRIALIRAMGFERSDRLYTNARAREVIGSLTARVQELADDVGLVREADLIDRLPDGPWHRFWPWLRRLADLRTLFGVVAIHDNAKSRAKAALLSIGRPATREEVAAICGLSATQTAGAFSNIPSIVKADRDRWALREWVDDEYDGIVGEIIQRIEEDGGATTAERLLSELPAKFNVSPQSVRAYMKSSRFEVRNGSVSLADPGSIRRRDLDDAIHGRDEGGAPYWIFVVEDRYLQGYSVVGVPPEFAKALGCEPDSGVDVRIENLPDCRALSLRWRLSTLTGASLGYLAEPLGLLGLRPGDRARVTIVAAGAARLSPEGGATPPRRQEADETVARMLKRRRAI